MTIDELNRKIKNSDWGIQAKIIDGNTFFYGIDDDEILKLDRNNTVSLFRTKLANFGFFKIISEYVDTPVDERNPEKKYNIILFKDIDPNNTQFLTMIQKDGNCRAIRANEDCDISDKGNPNYQFTKAEIDSIIERRPKYENVIKAAMVEVED